jgi:hypothetical protein
MPSKDPAITTAIDVAEAVGAEISRAVSRALEQCALLESIGSRAFYAAGDLGRDATADELLDRAHALRGLVLHASTALAELSAVAGALSVLAAIRERIAEDGHA